MRLIHFRHPTLPGIRFGILRDDHVLDASVMLADPDMDSTDLGFSSRFDLDGPVLPELTRGIEALPALPTAEISLLAPVPRPGKVVCIGLNYADHAEESGMEPPESPLVFSKFSSNVVGPGAVVPMPEGDSETDYEAELVVVIGRRAWRIDEDQAMEHVLGYTCANDLSARGFQFADGQWQRGKSCEGFCPLGPFIATKDEIPDPHDLGIRLRLNGVTMQESWTSQLIFKVPELVAHLSGFVTLEPGDVILTGTPPGVGFAKKPPIRLAPGDHMTVEIDRLGSLKTLMG
ncbi:MAG: fumarylacetoacetate hydrolase family protein [Phycisphaera sp.]|nr:fumarylacetoacetate hydrolase family protein [Phycisphaera sp.]